MPQEIRYRVTEAVLVPDEEKSVWRLTFTPEPVQSRMTDGTDGSLVINLSPGVVDNMFFDVTYSPEEITALIDGTWDG